MEDIWDPLWQQSHCHATHVMIHTKIPGCQVLLKRVDRMTDSYWVPGQKNKPHCKVETFTSKQHMVFLYYSQNCCFQAIEKLGSWPRLSWDACHACARNEARNPRNPKLSLFILIIYLSTLQNARHECTVLKIISYHDILQFLNLYSYSSSGDGLVRFCHQAGVFHELIGPLPLK